VISVAELVQRIVADAEMILNRLPQYVARSGGTA